MSEHLNANYMTADPDAEVTLEDLLQLIDDYLQEGGSGGQGVILGGLAIVQDPEEEYSWEVYLREDIIEWVRAIRREACDRAIYPGIVIAHAPPPRLRAQF